MTAKVISFAAVLNERRATSILTAKEQALCARLEAERVALVEAFKETTKSDLVANVAAEIVMSERSREEAARTSQYVPAYCDPNNDVRGSKHDATRGMRVQDIAGRMRQDIKDAVKTGLLPKGLKVSVRSDHNSIDVRITALPAGIALLSPKMASWCKQFPTRQYDAPFYHEESTSEELRAILATLKQIHRAYNRDNSDTQSDYFDVRYYGDVSVHWELSNAMRAAEIESSAGDYWAE